MKIAKPAKYRFTDEHRSATQTDIGIPKETHYGTATLAELDQQCIDGRRNEHAMVSTTRTRMPLTKTDTNSQRTTQIMTRHRTTSTATRSMLPNDAHGRLFAKRNWHAEMKRYGTTKKRNDKHEFCSTNKTEDHQFTARCTSDNAQQL